jgi:DNA-binding transcriptional LysR family regulator
LPKPFEKDLSEHLQTEVLFHDQICLAASVHSHWARQRRINLAELATAALISPSADTPGGAAVAEAYRAAGLPDSQATVTTFSVHLRSILSMRGRFIAVLPVSILRFNPELYSLKELPLEVPMPRWPALIVTLKNRTLSAAVERFLGCARDTARAVQGVSSSPPRIKRPRRIAPRKAIEAMSRSSDNRPETSTRHNR